MAYFDSLLQWNFLLKRDVNFMKSDLMKKLYDKYYSHRA